MRVTWSFLLALSAILKVTMGFGVSCPSRTPTTTTMFGNRGSLLCMAAKKSKKEDAEEESGTREERYEKAFEEAKAMKVGELKKALTDRGISTASFFEKTEFIKAYAEAIADNKTGSSSGGAGFGKQSKPKEEEKFDPDYKDVNMQRFDPRSVMGQPVIDVKSK